MANRIRSVADAERLARRRLPRELFDRIASGAGQELTLRWNVEAFDEVIFNPKTSAQRADYNLSTTVLGNDIAIPIMIAPTGNIRMFRVEGEPSVAKAAGDMGTIHIVSAFMGYPIEDIVSQSAGPVFFDLLLTGGRAVAEVMLSRARSAGCKALVVTMDRAGTHPVERLMTSRPAPPLAVNLTTALRYAPQLVLRPGWTADFVRDGMHLDCPMWVKDDGKFADWGDVAVAVRQPSATPTWSDVPWIREQWDGPLVLKGILRVDDAMRAIDEGVDGIVVSNHGGRAVDGSPASLHVLPQITDAVDGRIEVYFDGGIRRGTDVVKAVALGARAVLIGRAYIYPFAAAGGAGVRRILEVFGASMRATLRSLGCPSVRDLDGSYVTAEKGSPSVVSEAFKEDRAQT
jgi:isopentenyl diphosphate isomerase/L-lactate dehydrogenase-like FMN-dependent dehydrogenase